MTWVVTFVLAALAFCALAFLLKAPRSGWEAIGAALLLGIAGYGLQGSPGLAGAPKLAAETVAANPAALVEARQHLSGRRGVAGDNWLVVGDALARNGQYANAASVLLGAVEKDPRNGEAWLAMANALVSHADGQLTPASLYAFQHASEAAPGNPGPPFFLGLALAQSGRLTEARQLWGELLTRTPADAPWRADLETRIARLDEFIAAREQAPQVQ
jgi:cytochrome c-type biogenesis protein CcmH